MTDYLKLAREKREQAQLGYLVCPYALCDAIEAQAAEIERMREEISQLRRAINEHIELD